MQTQSIKLQVQSIQTRTTSISTAKSKSGKDSFDNIIKGRENDMSAKSNASLDKNKISKAGSSKESERVKDNYSGSKMSDKVKKNDDFSEDDVLVVEERIERMISVQFEMTVEDTEDVLEIMGLSALDLLFFMTDGGIMGPQDNSNIRDFIMELHGVTDEMAFLTSDIMNDERNNLISGLNSLLSDVFGADSKNFKANEGLFKSFMEKFESMISGNDAKMLNGESDAEGEESLIAVVDANSSEESLSTLGASESENSGAGGEGVENGNNPEGEKGIADSRDSQLSMFADRLSDSITNTATAEEITETQATMSRIVEQVVKQIRIRVLPQTRSMELQLNPENLGRVNLNVVHAGGVLRATLTVQNQIAKEALESQMAVLKENFESHGLKVESVEVNVSEFGFKKEGNEFANQNHGQNGNGKQSDRAKRARIRNIMSGFENGEIGYLSEPDETVNSEGTLDYTV